jgi:hypothetical protein
MLTRIRHIARRFISTSPDERHLHEMYTAMHTKGAFLGVSWKSHVETFCRTVPKQAREHILDFGCGPKGGLALEFGEAVISYDPHVPAFSAAPWERHFDSIFSSDVLEHMSLSQLGEFLDHAGRSSASYIFLNVSTRKAFKSLPDGSNAHLTVKPAKWWLEFVLSKLGDEFEPTLANEDLLRSEVTLCLQRKGAAAERRSRTAEEQNISARPHIEVSR